MLVLFSMTLAQENVKIPLPAVCAKPRKVQHFGMPMVESGMKPFEATGLAIRGETLDVIKKCFLC